MAVGNLFQNSGAEKLPKFHHAFLMARGAKIPTLTRVRDKKLMPAVTAFDAGEAIVKIAAVKVAIDDLFDVGPPEAKFLGKPLIVDPNELFEKVLDASVICRRLGISRSVYG